MQGFLLHTFQRDRKGRSLVFGIGRLKNGQTFGFVADQDRPACYIRAAEAERAAPVLKAFRANCVETSHCAMDGAPMLRVDASRGRDLIPLGDELLGAGVRSYEADIPFHRQFLLNRGIRRAVEISGDSQPGVGVDLLFRNPELSPSDWEPELRVLSFDLETTRRADQIFGVSLVLWGGGAEPVEEILIGAAPDPGDPPAARACGDERGMLEVFSQRVHELDPDIMTGWNIIDFDVPVLAKRYAAHRLPWALGRARAGAEPKPRLDDDDPIITIQGRQLLDGLRVIRSTLERYDDYKLKTVAQTVLGRGKLIDTEDDEDEDMPKRIERAFREDRQLFCDYCLEDSRLVRDILLEKGLVELTVRRSALTGLSLERAWGSVTAFEYLYITQLHEMGLVAPTGGVDQDPGQGVVGGLVMEASAGIHHNVLIFDFKSLYPSIMRTFNIDPLAYVRGQAASDEAVVVAPNGTRFARDIGILPHILETFFEARAQAKAAGDPLASYAYKIVMNSFYGVLGTPACRFSSPHVAGSITAFSHALMIWAREWMEARGFTVLYGDTDSLFADPKLPIDISAADALARGEAIRVELNAAIAEHIESTYGVVSHLDLELEKFYRRLFIPGMRGESSRGRAKGYAGLSATAEGETLEVIGMEAVRRDWTQAARQLQRELLMMVFRDADPADIERHVADSVAALRAGKRDADLVYRKNLRKAVSAYTSSQPPHVKAAALLKHPGPVIRYLMTTAGPQPLGHCSAAIDYEHYVQKQIVPIAMAFEPFLPVDISGAISGEQRLL